MESLNKYFLSAQKSSYGLFVRLWGKMRSTGLKSGKNMDRRGLVSLRRFVRIVTEGGTPKEIYALWDTVLDYHKKHDDCDFWRFSIVGV